MATTSKRNTSGIRSKKKRKPGPLSLSRWRLANSRIVVKDEIDELRGVVRIWAEDSETGERLVFKLITWE
jgi:hypothetical protein